MYVLCFVNLDQCYDVIVLLQDFTTNLFLRQIWIDPRLAFYNYTDVTYDVMTLNYRYLDDIWQPDLYIKNEIHDGTVHEISVPNVMLTVSSDGTVFYSQRYGRRCSARPLLMSIWYQSCRTESLISSAVNERPLSLMSSNTVYSMYLMYSSQQRNTTNTDVLTLAAKH